MLVSGSASSPIFKKSRESLIGRIRDHHLLSFSFRKFILFSLSANPRQPSLYEEVNNIYLQGKTIQGIVTDDPTIEDEKTSVQLPSESLRIYLDAKLNEYLVAGGVLKCGICQTGLPDRSTCTITK